MTLLGRPLSSASDVRHLTRGLSIVWGFAAAVVFGAVACASATEEPATGNPDLSADETGTEAIDPATGTVISPGSEAPGVAPATGTAIQPMTDPVTGTVIPPSPGTPMTDPVTGTVIPPSPDAPTTDPVTGTAIPPTTPAPGAGGAGAAPVSGDGGAGSVTAGPGVLVDGVCQPICSPAAQDDDGNGEVDAGDSDGWGFEAGASCVIAGSATAMGTTCEPPPPDSSTLPPPGDGFFIDEVCHPPCASATSDDNGDGVVDAEDTDGWGWEQERTCVVPESTAAAQGVPCIPEVATDLPPPGDGFQRDGVCYAPCPDTVTADEQGWGYIAATEQTCIAAGSAAALAGLPCIPEDVALPEPGDGFFLGGECFPPCSSAESASPDADGWGYEDNRTCVLPGSTAAGMGAPCVPPELPPPGTEGQCPAESQLQCPNGRECGCLLVAGLGARKQQILDAVAAVGGDQMMLASAMMETEDLTSNYTLGDGKSGDSFNAGICKQNWGMIRQCHVEWNGLGAGDAQTSTALNSDLNLDAQVYKECRDRFGDTWFGGHRNGSTGLANPNTADITAFRTATEWTWGMLQNGHLADDTRFWADVPAIR